MIDFEAEARNWNFALFVSAPYDEDAVTDIADFGKAMYQQAQKDTVAKAVSMFRSVMAAYEQDCGEAAYDTAKEAIKAMMEVES